MIFDDEEFKDLEKDFKLTLFVYFQNKTSSIGIEIFEALKALQSKH